jgi:RNA polymerase sigma-70 factor (ECF subfamily)
MGNEDDSAQVDRKRQFDALVAGYEAALLRYVARLLNSADSAQDVVQDAFISCYRHWEGDLAPNAHLLRWLYRVAHNRAIDMMRQTSRREAVHAAHTIESLGEEAARQSLREVSDAAQKASDALRTLNVREQQVVILKVYEERSYREISDLLGITVSNVGYILHHAMRKLAEALKEDRKP